MSVLSALTAANSKFSKLKYILLIFYCSSQEADLRSRGLEFSRLFRFICFFLHYLPVQQISASNRKRQPEEVPVHKWICFAHVLIDKNECHSKCNCSYCSFHLTC